MLRRAEILTYCLYAAVYALRSLVALSALDHTLAVTTMETAISFGLLTMTASLHRLTTGTDKKHLNLISLFNMEYFPAEKMRILSQNCNSVLYAFIKILNNQSLFIV